MPASKTWQNWQTWPVTTMSPDELEDLAFRGKALPVGLTYSDTLLFLSLRALYKFAEMVHMGPEQGHREKQQILRQVEHFKAAQEYEMAIARKTAAINLAVDKLMENPSQETANAVYRAVYGLEPPKFAPETPRTHETP